LEPSRNIKEGHEFSISLYRSVAAGHEKGSWGGGAPPSSTGRSGRRTTYGMRFLGQDGCEHARRRPNRLCTRMRIDAVKYGVERAEISSILQTRGGNGGGNHQVVAHQPPIVVGQRERQCIRLLTSRVVTSHDVVCTRIHCSVLIIENSRASCSDVLQSAPSISRCAAGALRMPRRSSAAKS